MKLISVITAALVMVQASPTLDSELLEQMQRDAAYMNRVMSRAMNACTNRERCLIPESCPAFHRGDGHDRSNLLTFVLSSTTLAVIDPVNKMAYRVPRDFDGSLSQILETEMVSAPTEARPLPRERLEEVAALFTDGRACLGFKQEQDSKQRAKDKSA